MMNNFIIRRRTLMAILLAGVAWLSGCQKGAELFVPDPGQPNGADTNWVSGVTGIMPIAILQDSIALQPQADSLESNITDTIATGGIQIIVPGSSLQNAAGISVEGRLKVEYLTLQKRGDLIRLNTPTIRDSAVLSTLGTFFIGFTQNGNELYLKPSAAVNLIIPGQAIAQPSKFYFGFRGQQGIYNWYPADSSSNHIDFSNNRYFATTNILGWMSAGYTLPAASNQLQLTLPPQYTNANTAAYVVLNNRLSIVRMSDNVSTKKFVCGIIPQNESATVVVISKQGNDYFAGTEIFTSADGTQVVNLLPVKISLSALRQLLDRL